MSQFRFAFSLQGDTGTDIGTAFCHVSCLKAYSMLSVLRFSVRVRVLKEVPVESMIDCGFL
jgi:hypothetical protein